MGFLMRMLVVLSLEQIYQSQFDRLDAQVMTYSQVHHNTHIHMNTVHVHILHILKNIK